MKRTLPPMTTARVFLPIILICVLASATSAFAEDRPVNPFNKTAYGYLKAMVLASAEKMPEENYAFKPTEAVRSYGQILGHVADSQYLFCSMALGEKNPTPKVEKTRSSKAELVTALKDSFSYCDHAYETMTPTSAAEIVNFHGMNMTKLDVLTANNMHTVEHYGNIITYLRLKNIVPPSSDPEFNPVAKK